MVHCVAGQETIIGNNVTVGHGAILHSCIIEDDSLIGMGAIVLDGARVGKNCLVGAGAVVTPNTIVPEGSLVVGSPAKVKRELTDKEMEHIRANALEYITLSKEYLEMTKEE
jgi:carbonic anhydrase/acetyltransferase-like protein (isoleucine patch superfamily)